jgi:hypothetical protein
MKPTYQLQCSPHAPIPGPGDPIAWIWVGYPGSGKTFWARHFYNHPNTVEMQFVLIDDPVTKEEVTKHLGRNLLIADPHLVVYKNRQICFDILEKACYHQFWCFFEDDKEKCRKNLVYRNDGRVINIDAFKYDVPKGESLNPIWQPE